jgi:hypothetical protein
MEKKLKNCIKSMVVWQLPWKSVLVCLFSVLQKNKAQEGKVSSHKICQSKKHFNKTHAVRANTRDGVIYPITHGGTTRHGHYPRHGPERPGWRD